MAIKASTNSEALGRENYNYDRIAKGRHASRFVTKHEFLTRWGGPTFAAANALVLERGERDLKTVLAEREGRGLEGRAMRDAAHAAALCVQAVHSAKMVWTDLKPENFVTTSESIGADPGEGLQGVKGIDLESAMPVGENPVDYSPEACPPEFAEAFQEGRALEFVLEYNYDAWSLGMLLYELATGKPYFVAETAEQITEALAAPDFKADVREVEGKMLRNLIGKCLQKKPGRRPSISEILLHPYFITTGMGFF